MCVLCDTLVTKDPQSSLQVAESLLSSCSYILLMKCDSPLELEEPHLPLRVFCVRWLYERHWHILGWCLLMARCATFPCLCNLLHIQMLCISLFVFKSAFQTVPWLVCSCSLLKKIEKRVRYLTSGFGCSLWGPSFWPIGLSLGAASPLLSLGHTCPSPVLCPPWVEGVIVWLDEAGCACRTFNFNMPGMSGSNILLLGLFTTSTWPPEGSSSGNVVFGLKKVLMHLFLSCK